MRRHDRMGHGSLMDYAAFFKLTALSTGEVYKPSEEGKLYIGADAATNAVATVNRASKSGSWCDWPV